MPLISIQKRPACLILLQTLSTLIGLSVAFWITVRMSVTRPPTRASTCTSTLTPRDELRHQPYQVGDAAFIHDMLFLPDGGTARVDFPGGSAQ